MGEANGRDVYIMADELRYLVSKRTGLKSTELQCPREKSAYTPCVARDGSNAVCERFGVPDICAGCEHSVDALLRRELANHGGR